MQANRSMILEGTKGRTIRIVSLGHAFFAVVMIGLGILGMIKSECVSIWTGVPKNMLAREMLSYLCAFTL